MTKEEIIKNDLDLHSEWMKYSFENPDVLDRIPKGAVLVILPEDNKDLYAENYKILEQNKRKGIPVFDIYHEDAEAADIEHRDYCSVNFSKG